MKGGVKTPESGSESGQKRVRFQGGRSACGWQGEGAAHRDQGLGFVEAGVVLARRRFRPQTRHVCDGCCSPTRCDLQIEVYFLQEGTLLRATIAGSQLPAPSSSPELTARLTCSCPAHKGAMPTLEASPRVAQKSAPGCSGHITRMWGARNASQLEEPRGQLFKRLNLQL